MNPQQKAKKQQINILKRVLDDEFEFVNLQDYNSYLIAMKFKGSIRSEINSLKEDLIVFFDKFTKTNPSILTKDGWKWFGLPKMKNLPLDMVNGRCNVGRCTN